MNFGGLSFRAVRLTHRKLSAGILAKDLPVRNYVKEGQTP